MGERGFGVREIRLAVRVAVEREQTTGRHRHPGEIVVDVLPRWIAVDLDGHMRPSRRGEDRLPVGRDAGPRSVHPAAGMAQDVDAWCRHGAQQSRRLIGGRAER